jgi:hypothetical protein
MQKRLSRPLPPSGKAPCATAHRAGQSEFHQLAHNLIMRLSTITGRMTLQNLLHPACFFLKLRHDLMRGLVVCATVQTMILLSAMTVETYVSSAQEQDSKSFRL